MYTIGQFSKIGRVSTKTLRYYDDIELLKPAYVDRTTQYRYYSYEQALQLLSITELKEYGLKLEEIKAIMDKQDVDLLKKFLNNKITEIDKEVQNSLKLKDSIEEKIKKIESGGNIMEAKKDLKVELKERQPLVVISRRTITSMSNISCVIGKVFEDIFKMNLKPAGPVMTVYHDKQEFDVENADCEICVPVNSNANMEKTEKIKEFAGGLVATTTFVGPYSRLGEAYAKVTKWIEDNGYKYAGAPFDIYLNGPQSVKSPEEFVTEVCFPISK
ncbi:MerR family transcriptional regulator [Clostridium chromiireducens]|uniref:MerR family transcriptional regulator n=1 Tax=Clostridium chromiireducens TaxID=225345 RepID=A0A964RPU5_9CLOT|nr:MerR family transcriptional regulator [Clostridium chromiireducens]